MRRLSLLVWLAPLALAGCIVTAGPQRFLAEHAVPEPRVDAVTVCHGYGCRLRTTVDLSAEWPKLTAPLATPAATPAEERRHIAEVIGAIEVAVAPQAGTGGDLGGTFAGFGLSGQLDCIDETTNTTEYLTLLQRGGLLHWYEVAAPMSRGFFIIDFPHTSAVITERDGTQSFAVDSWFHDNGVPPEIVPLDTWLAGWYPPPDKTHGTAVARTASASGQAASASNSATAGAPSPTHVPAHPR